MNSNNILLQQLNDFLLTTFKIMIKNSSDLLFIKDCNFNYITASTPFLNLLGLNTVEDIYNKSDYDLFDEMLAKSYRLNDLALIDSKIPIINHIEPIPDENGEKRYSSTSKYLIYDDNNVIIGLYGIGRDVTAEIKLQDEIERREQSIKLYDDVLEADISENIMLRIADSIWAKKLDLKDSNKFTDAVDMFAKNYIHNDYVDEFITIYNRDKLLNNFKFGEQDFSHITYLIQPDNSYRWVEFTTRLYHSRTSNTLRITSFLKDLDKEIKSKEELLKKSQTDALTGLLNRKSVLELISNDLINNKDVKNSLLFLDLDYFKTANDTFGHLFGDKILIKISNLLLQVFGNDAYIGRVGGDEFLIYLKNTNSHEDIKNKTKEFFKHTPFNYTKGNKSISLTCSIGVSFSQNNKKLEMLYLEADTAMYKAKELGRNRIAFF